MAERLTFTEFVDFVLLKLYELDKRSGSEQFEDVRMFASELLEPVDRHWTEQAAQVLIADGLAKDGGIDQAPFVALTGRGRLYVEGRDHKTDLIEEYRQAPSNFVVVSGVGHQVAVGTGGDVSQVAVSGSDREQLLALVEQIRSTIVSDDTLDESRRTDALADVEAIEGSSRRAP